MRIIRTMHLKHVFEAYSVRYECLKNVPENVIYSLGPLCLDPFLYVISVNLCDFHLRINSIILIFLIICLWLSFAESYTLSAMMTPNLDLLCVVLFL